MALTNTDLLLVSRGGTNYKTPASNIMGLQNTDLLPVNRGGVNYKITGLELKNFSSYSEANFAQYWVSSSTGYNLVNVSSARSIYPVFAAPSGLSMSYGLAGFFFGVDETGGTALYSGGSKTDLTFTGGPASSVRKFTIRYNSTASQYERFVLYENGELYRNSSTNYYDTPGALTLIDTNVVTINSIYDQDMVWTKTDGTIKYVGRAQLSTSTFGTQTAQVVGTVPVTLPVGKYATSIIPLGKGASNTPDDGSLAVLLDDGTIYRWGNYGGTKAAPELYSPVGVTFRSISGTAYGPTGSGGIMAISTGNQIYGFNSSSWNYLFSSSSSAAPLFLAGGTLGGSTTYNAAFVGTGAGAGQTATAVVMIQGTDGKLYCATNKSGSAQVVQLQTSLATNSLAPSLFGYLSECTSLTVTETPGQGSGEWYGYTNWLFF